MCRQSLRQQHKAWQAGGKDLGHKDTRALKLDGSDVHLPVTSLDLSDHRVSPLGKVDSKDG